VHEHCANLSCGAILRRYNGSVIQDGWNGYVCARCKWQLTGDQLVAITPPVARPRWWRRH
jgi:hypothetical protein